MSCRVNQRTCVDVAMSNGLIAKGPAKHEIAKERKVPVVRERYVELSGRSRKSAETLDDSDGVIKMFQDIVTTDRVEVSIKLSDDVRDIALKYFGEHRSS